MLYFIFLQEMLGINSFFAVIYGVIVFLIRLLNVNLPVDVFFLRKKQSHKSNKQIVLLWFVVLRF